MLPDGRGCIATIIIDLPPRQCCAAMEEQARSLCDHQETAEAAQRCLVVRPKLYLSAPGAPRSKVSQYPKIEERRRGREPGEEGKYLCSLCGH